MADFLNTTFYGLDKSMFLFVNSMAKSGGKIFTPLLQFITFFGDKAWFFIALSIVLLLFVRHRKAGFCMLMSIIVGALFTNVFLKGFVARPRPYTVDEFRPFWEFVGASVESEFSLPSGHTTSAIATAMAFFLCKDKKYSYLFFIFSLLVAFSRIYLVVHYTTDVIGGIIVGSVSGVIAFFITKLVFNIIDKNSKNKFFNFINTFDIIKVFKKNK